MIYVFIFSGTNIFCKVSVDTTILGVDTMVQNKGRNVKKSPSQVDTSPGQVSCGESFLCRRWPTALLEAVSGRGAIRACGSLACLSYKPVVLFLRWLPRQFSFTRC
ncbi:hypothetical protein Taro_033444, partial [Colocasia esculenta]|nr:hypothetical protein [Colocasia esculenta]